MTRLLKPFIDRIKGNGFKLTKERLRRYPAKTITNADYVDDIVLLANAPAQAETLLHNLERAAVSLILHVNAQKTEYMCFNQRGDISTLNGCSLKLVDKFTYLGSSVSSIETDMKPSFFLAAVVSILLYGCTTWTLTKRVEKKLDGNYTRMLRASPGGSTQQSSSCTYHPFTKTIKIRRIRHAGHCWRCRDELISYVLLWTPSHGLAKAGRPARTHIEQLWVDTGCSPEELQER